MAKRFTDSEKWDDPWFSELPNKYKLFWILLLDKCDHAGFYKVNLKMANFLLDEKYSLSEIKQVFNRRIQELSPEKWFIPKFINFQYGELNSESRVHQSIIKILKKEGVSKGCARGVNTTKDKNKDKDKVKAKDKDKYLKYVLLTKEEYSKLVDKFGESGTKEHIARLNDGIGSKGYKYESHYYTILNWARKDKKDLPIKTKEPQWRTP